MRGIREEEQVRLAVDEALEKWNRAFDAWEAATWTLMREPEFGKALNEAGNVRAAMFDGARSIDMPSIEIIYRFDKRYIYVEYVRFFESPYRQAGHG